MSKNEDRYNVIRSTVKSNDSMIIVKGVCGEEIRRIPILNREMTFDELCFMMHRLFRDRLSTNLENMILKYTDQDGDLVTMTDTLDISHALEYSNVLRITVFDKEKLPVPRSDYGNLAQELNKLKLTPQRAKGLKDSLLGLQRQINDIIQTYCNDSDSPSPQMENFKEKERVEKSLKPKEGPILSTADIDIVDSSSKISSSGLTIDFSKPRGYSPNAEGFDPIKNEPQRNMTQFPQGTTNSSQYPQQQQQQNYSPQLPIQHSPQHMQQQSQPQQHQQHQQQMHHHQQHQSQQSQHRQPPPQQQQQLSNSQYQQMPNPQQQQPQQYYQQNQPQGGYPHSQYPY